MNQVILNRCISLLEDLALKCREKQAVSSRAFSLAQLMIAPVEVVNHQNLVLPMEDHLSPDDIRRLCRALAIAKTKRVDIGMLPFIITQDNIGLFFEELGKVNTLKIVEFKTQRGTLGDAFALKYDEGIQHDIIDARLNEILRCLPALSLGVGLEEIRFEKADSLLQMKCKELLEGLEATDFGSLTLTGINLKSNLDEICNLLNGGFLRKIDFDQCIFVGLLPSDIKKLLGSIKAGRVEGLSIRNVELKNQLSKSAFSVLANGLYDTHLVSFAFVSSGLSRYSQESLAGLSASIRTSAISSLNLSGPYEGIGKDLVFSHCLQIFSLISALDNYRLDNLVLNDVLIDGALRLSNQFLQWCRVANIGHLEICRPRNLHANFIASILQMSTLNSLTMSAFSEANGTPVPNVLNQVSMADTPQSRLPLRSVGAFDSFHLASRVGNREGVVALSENLPAVTELIFAKRDFRLDIAELVFLLQMPDNIQNIRFLDINATVTIASLIKMYAGEFQHKIQFVDTELNRNRLAFYNNQIDSEDARKALLFRNVSVVGPGESGVEEAYQDSRLNLKRARPN